MTAVITAAVSGVCLLAFIGLLHAEAARGRRIILPRIRTTLDSAVLRAYRSLVRMQVYLGTGAMRIAFLRGMQRILEAVLRANEFIATRVYRLLQRNRRTVRIVRRTQEKTYLDILTEHRAEQTLSDEERDELKRRAIEGE